MEIAVWMFIVGYGIIALIFLFAVPLLFNVDEDDVEGVVAASILWPLFSCFLLFAGVTYAYIFYLDWVREYRNQDKSND